MIYERLERLPLGTFHKRLFLVSGLGWLFDAMDVGIISFCSGVIVSFTVGAFISNSFSFIFRLFASVLLLAALNIAVQGEETKGKTLEEISG